MLKNVTFQKDLGSYYDKTLRVQRLCQLAGRDRRAERHGGSAGSGAQGGAARQDRSHHRIGEGVYRAAGNRRRPVRQVQQLDPGPAGGDAVGDRAMPSTISTSRSRWRTRSRAPSKARCSRSPTRPTRSPACSRWACMPSGSKDPFALRRQANGIVKTIAEHKLPLPSVGDHGAMRARGYSGSEAEKKFVERGVSPKSVAQLLPRASGILSADARGYRL